MRYIREFEFYKGEKYMLAVPFGMDGGTFGDGFEDAVESATDWLYETVKVHFTEGSEVPGGTFGNEPQYGGKVVAVSVECDFA